MTKSELVSRMQSQGRPDEFVLAIKFMKAHSEKSLEAATSDDINHKLKKKTIWCETALNASALLFGIFLCFNTALWLFALN